MFSFLFAFDFSSVFAIVCDGVRCKPAVLHRWRAFLQSAIVQLQLTLQDCALQPNNNPTEIRSKDLANLPQVQQKNMLRRFWCLWESFSQTKQISGDFFAIFLPCLLPYFKPYLSPMFFYYVFRHILFIIFCIYILSKLKISSSSKQHHRNAVKISRIYNKSWHWW